MKKGQHVGISGIRQETWTSADNNQPVQIDYESIDAILSVVTGTLFNAAETTATIKVTGTLFQSGYATLTLLPGQQVKLVNYPVREFVPLSVSLIYVDIVVNTVPEDILGHAEIEKSIIGIRHAAPAFSEQLALNGFSNSTSNYYLLVGFSFTAPSLTTTTAPYIYIEDSAGNIVDEWTIQPWQENSTTLTFQGSIYQAMSKKMLIPPGYKIAASGVTNGIMLSGTLEDLRGY